ncbi:hypothetical protein EP10_002810 [Geobacillus icigianus]|uniref:Uncharacterized protein n=1 Tax=Geobacillus icigianus TaxID=1430331 RepID=A0ABU6BKK7_9BACL|nr:hypothetical protein [Geobacillus icigianus]
MITFFIDEVKHQSVDIGDMDRYHFEFLQPIFEHKRFAETTERGKKPKG